MLGAIAGDIIGSTFEFEAIKTTAFRLFSSKSDFTDDTVLTVAVADCLLHGLDYAACFKNYVHRFPGRGYGTMFAHWAIAEISRPYHSWGNGSAMRVSPVGWAFNTLEEVLAQAKRSAEVTHNHPEGIKGAQATAAAIFLGRTKKSKDEIKSYITQNFGYNLTARLDDLRPGFGFDESCQGTIPPALICFLESAGYEDAVRKAVSLGGDSDTLACITGGIAEAFYGGVPEPIRVKTLFHLDPALKGIISEFRHKYLGV